MLLELRVITAGGTVPVTVRVEAGTAVTQLSQLGSVAAGTPVPFAAGASVAPTILGAGALVGRWEIIKRLGSGGMADVYLARARGEAGFEKTVAVKVMHPHLARMQSQVKTAKNADPSCACRKKSVCKSGITH